MEELLSRIEAARPEVGARLRDHLAAYEKYLEVLRQTPELPSERQHARLLAGIQVRDATRQALQDAVARALGVRASDPV